MQHILLALLIGGAFGFVLDRIGATNPGYIIKMLNLSNLHLMKTILAGIGIASVLTFGGLMMVGIATCLVATVLILPALLLLLRRVR